MTLDPSNPFLSPEPREWDGSLSAEDKTWLARLPAILSDEQKARREVILRQMRQRRWFLLRNVHGFKCTRCSLATVPVIHEFVSVACLPYPFNADHEPIATLKQSVTRERGHIHGERVTVEEVEKQWRRIGGVVPITVDQARRYQAAAHARYRQRR